MHIFAISLGTFMDEFDFLPAGKHQGFLPVDAIILCVVTQACLKYIPKISLHIFAVSLGTRGDAVDFLPADKYKIVLQFDSKTLALHC